MPKKKRRGSNISRKQKGKKHVCSSDSNNIKKRQIKSKALPKKQDNDHSDASHLTGLQHQILSKYNKLKKLAYNMCDGRQTVSVVHDQFTMTIDIVESIDGINMRSVNLYVDPTCNLIKAVGKLNHYPVKIIIDDGKYTFLDFDKHINIDHDRMKIQPRDNGESTSTKRGRCLVEANNDIVRLKIGDQYEMYDGRYVDWQENLNQSDVSTIKAPPLINFGIKPSEIEIYSSAQAAMNYIVRFFNINLCIGCHKSDLSIVLKAQKDRLERVSPKKLKTLKKSNISTLNCFVSKTVKDSSIRVLGGTTSTKLSPETSLMYTEYKNNNGLLSSSSSSLLPSHSKWSIRPNTCKITVDKNGTCCDICNTIQKCYLKDSNERRIKSKSEILEAQKKKKKVLQEKLRNLKKKYKRLENKYDELTAILNISKERAKQLSTDVQDLIANDTSSLDKIIASEDKDADDENTNHALDARIEIIDDAASILMAQIKHSDLEQLADAGYISKNTKNIEMAAALLTHQADMYKRAKDQKSKKGIRYSDKVFAFAVAIERTSPSAYEMLQSVMTLPTRGQLRRQQFRAPSTDGVRDEDVVLLEQQLKRLGGFNNFHFYKYKNKKLLLLSASLDAMVCRTGVYYDSNTDKIVGFCGEEVMNLKTVVEGFNHHYLGHKDLARYCSVLMVSSTGGAEKYTFPLGSWCTNTITATMNISFVIDAVLKLPKQRLLRRLSPTIIVLL
eukprot:g8126.t1